MNYRVYVSDRDQILSGKLTDDLYGRIKQYQEFFGKQDSNGEGNGIFEAELPKVSDYQGRNVCVRATSEEIEFGIYGYEGWEKLFKDYTFKQNGTTVIFDRMILHYVHKNATDAYDFYITYQEATDQIDERDWDILDKAMNKYIEETQVE